MNQQNQVMLKALSTIIFICFSQAIIAQDYFFAELGPFNPSITTPEEFLGYPIGDHHTRHDRIVAYFEKLAEESDRAELNQYGQTYEHRRLVMLTITDPKNLRDLDKIQKEHLEIADPENNISNSSLPIIINLAYNVHGNEPSGAEAALLTAYWLCASEHPDVVEYLENAIMMVDPTINPDGRDRHTHWANMYKGNPLVADPQDAEHNEGWPRGRTNHYWFDLNRDWLLGIHPESRGKLNWYHQWYPNVVTDFHEMGTNSTYFFEPMKDNASKDPIMPKENYTTLNETFAKYYTHYLNDLGSLYFTKEVFDGTYPGYGSSYPDLQGGLGILFEQASSRGHLQETHMGDLTFAFTIRNQFACSRATVQAAFENKFLLRDYQLDFFQSAIKRADQSGISGYVFGDAKDENRTRAFIDKLLLHRIKVYELNKAVQLEDKTFEAGKCFVVPTSQAQYRMVQTMFETYSEYKDSVYYDASAWSVANFYNMPYASYDMRIERGNEVTRDNNQTKVSSVAKSKYAYLISWDDYFAPAVLYHLQNNGVIVNSAFKPFTIEVDGNDKYFHYGSLILSVQKQNISADSLHQLLSAASNKFKVNIDAVNTGYSSEGSDLGSRFFRTLKKPKAMLLVGQGVSSYEAGEVWHLLDTRVQMPITKVATTRFSRADLDKYNVLIMVSGNYAQLDTLQKASIKKWAAKGNTLITIREASAWAIKNKLVKDSLLVKKPGKDKPRGAYVKAGEELGRERVGGAIFEIDLDITHPLGFGYHERKLPVYRNSRVWLKPSKNPYSTVAKYTDDPHIDGFITDKNLNEFLIPSASLIVSPMGRGRAVLFADNPNFRGSWYGTNRLFLNAIFLGEHIGVPKG